MYTYTIHLSIHMYDCCIQTSTQSLESSARSPRVAGYPGSWAGDISHWVAPPGEGLVEICAEASRREWHLSCEGRLKGPIPDSDWPIRNPSLIGKSTRWKRVRVVVLRDCFPQVFGMVGRLVRASVLMGQRYIHQLPSNTRISSSLGRWTSLDYGTDMMIIPHIAKNS